MKSERESSSAPNLLVLSSRRAIRPSSASNTAATMMAMTASSHLRPAASSTADGSGESISMLASSANLIEVSPAHKANRVSMLGISRLIEWSRNLVRRMALDPPTIEPAAAGSLCRRLPCLAKPRRLVRLGVRQDGFARHRALPDADQRRDAVRQVDIDPAAEPDQADPLPCPQRPARGQVALDAAGDQPGDLHHRDVEAILRPQVDQLALIVLARLVERRVDELARTVGHGDHLAVDRRAVHMHVEDVHENTNARQR